MKLKRLFSNNSSFRDINFNLNGLTLITGAKSSNDNNTKGSSNGIGKTTALRLLHFCLAGSAPPVMKNLPGWIFKLEFYLNNKLHTIERSNNDSYIALDGEEIKLKDLRCFFNNHGPFILDQEIPRLSFRALFPHFSRLNLKDMEDPKETHGDYSLADAILRTLYLMGANYSLAKNKITNKEQILNLQKAKKEFKDTPSLQEIFAVGNDPQRRLQWLNNNIEKITDQINDFEIFDAFEEIRDIRDRTLRGIKDLKHEISILNYQLEGIESSIQDSPDITAKKMIELYNGLEEIFRPEALEHLDAVEKFHKNLLEKRKTRFEEDKGKIESRKEKLKNKLSALKNNYADCEKKLSCKFSKEQYITLTSQQAEYKLEANRIENFLTVGTQLETKIRNIKALMLEDSNKAAAYVRKDPLAEQSDYFSSLMTSFYPDINAGITIENNDKNNKTQFNLDIYATSQLSSGVGETKIMCFDWLIFIKGSHHNMDFLWHDNILFANQDPEVRASWLKYISVESEKMGKQYIGTINIENFNSMRDYLTEEEMKKMEQSVVLPLSGNQDCNRLLGIKFNDN